MSPRTQHPPSTDDGQTRANTLRRAVFGGVAGVALLVGPVLLANVVVPDESGGTDTVEAAAQAETSLVALRQDATVTDAARAGALQSLRTTTTLPPTTPPTTPTDKISCGEYPTRVWA